MSERTKILLVAGARPNFMKIAPLARALAQRPERFEFHIVHTGQHYDPGMSEVFFQELGIPEPDFRLAVGSGTHARQTAAVMVAFEEVCLRQQPDLVLVVGDVNSTLACALVASKLHIAVAHVEAGLRSGDMRMPEEVNRVLTDAISDWLFVTEPSGVENLRREGRPGKAVHMVGHVMIDNLYYQLARLERGEPPPRSSALQDRLGQRYAVVTLHRPSNVDHEFTLRGICRALTRIAQDLPVVFPAHPRTRAAMKKFGIELEPGIITTEPLSFMEFLNLWRAATLVLTDSGGLQEETTALGIPCLTLRESTERPVTVEAGSNQIVGADPARIVSAASAALAGPERLSRRPALWDGHAAERIVDILAAEA